MSGAPARAFHRRSPSRTVRPVVGAASRMLTAMLFFCAETDLSGVILSKKKVVLVGTGNIAKTHAAALREIADTELYGVFDLNPKTAEGFAKEFGASRVFTTLEQAAGSAADTVHVLTPPDLHLATAMPFVNAGKAVLLEKPVGVNSAECEALAAAARQSGAVIGVNQNLVFNPAYVQLREAVTSGRLGRPRYLTYVYEAPLRQLTGKQFGHWMFREPLNILLEQAVHPLSQIVDLAGKVKELATLAEIPVEISPGVGLHNACQVSMLCERMPAHLRFHVGANFTVCRMTVVCDDGVAIADVFANQFHTVERSAYMEPIDNWLAARASGRQIAAEGFAGLRDYALAMIKLKPRSDAFYLGMKGSLQSFYADLQASRRPRIDLEFGAHLVNVCEQVVTLVQATAFGRRAAGTSRRRCAAGAHRGRAGRHRFHRLLHRGCAAAPGLPRARHGSRRGQPAAGVLPERRGDLPRRRQAQG